MKMNYLLLPSDVSILFKGLMKALKDVEKVIKLISHM